MGVITFVIDFFNCPSKALVKKFVFIRFGIQFLNILFLNYLDNVGCRDQ